MDLIFKVATELEKAEVTDDGRLLISGVCSDTSKDQQNDVLTDNCLKDMASNAVGVPIVGRHSSEMLDELGQITSSRYEDSKLHITAELDKDDSLAQRAFAKIKKSGKMQFSIGASVTRLAKNVDSSIRMTVEKVRLNHVALTSAAANKNTYCFATSLTKAMTLEDNMKPNKEVKPKTTEEVHPEVFESAPGVLITPEMPPVVKTGEKQITAPTPTIEKAGKKFSADTVGVLKQIHAAGSTDVKAMVASMFDNDDPDGAGLGAEECPGSDTSEKMIGVIDKAQIEAAVKLQFDAALPEIIKQMKIELAKSVKTNVSSPQSPSVQTIIAKALEQHPNDIGMLLRAAIS